MKSKLFSFLLAITAAFLAPALLHADDPDAELARAEKPAVKIHVQKLIDEAWAKFRAKYELTHLAIHAPTPGTSEYHEIARTPFLQRVIGLKTEAEDMDVATKNMPRLEPDLKKNNFELHIPLRDSAGHIVAILGLGFKYVSTQNDWEFIWRAVAIRDTIEPQIADQAQIFAPES